MTKPQIKQLNLEEVRLDFQPPENLIEETVREKMQRIRDGEPIEPIVVRFDGERYLLQDGFHRVEAARRCGIAKLDAEITPGSLQDMEAEYTIMVEKIKASMRDGNPEPHATFRIVVSDSSQPEARTLSVEAGDESEPLPGAKPC